MACSVGCKSVHGITAYVYLATFWSIGFGDILSKSNISPAKGEAILYDQLGLRTNGIYRCNLALARVTGVTEPWAVITDETPSLKTLWQYALHFRVEELFLDSKSGAFQLQDSAIRSAECIPLLQ